MITTEVFGEVLAGLGIVVELPAQAGKSLLGLPTQNL